MDSVRSLTEAQSSERAGATLPAVATVRTENDCPQSDDETLLPLSEATCGSIVEEIQRVAAERLDILKSVEELESDYARLYRDKTAGHIDESSVDAKSWRRSVFQAIQSDAVSQELREQVGAVATLTLE